MSLINQISFLDQKEIFDNFQRTFNCLDLDTKVLELINLTWVDVGVHAFDPDIAWGKDLGFGRHLYDLRLNDFLEFGVVIFSEDKSNFSNNKWLEFGKLWFSFIFIKVSFINRLVVSFIRENLNSKNSKVILTNDDSSSSLGNMFLSSVDLLGGNVNNVYYDDLIVGCEVLKEFINDLGLVLWERLSLHVVYKIFKIL